MIHTLRLRHFKAFETLELELGQLTLLSGLNSAGKSSILQAVGLLRQSANAGMLQHTASDHHGNEWLLNGALVQMGTARDIVYEWASDSNVRIELEASEGRFTFEAQVNNLDADVLECAVATRAETTRLPAALTAGFNYLRADRISPALVYPSSHQEVVRKRSLGVQGEYTVHYLAKFQDAPIENDAIREAGAPPGLLNQVVHWMNIIAPGIRVEPKALKGTDFVTVRFGFGAAAGLSGSSSYRPTHVGFGLTYTLPIIVAVLSMSPGDLLLLENPEAHVHPRGQAALGTMLARAAAGGLQVIVETHSDHVLNGIRLSAKDGLINPDDVALHFFQRTSPQSVEVESPIIDRSGRLSRWPAGFFDQWDHDLDRLLD